MTVTGYLAPITCRDCGGTLEHTASGTTDTLRASAIATCHNCARGWLITVTLTRAPGATQRTERTKRSEPRPTHTPTTDEPTGPLHPVIGLIMAATNLGKSGRAPEVAEATA